MSRSLVPANLACVHEGDSAVALHGGQAPLPHVNLSVGVERGGEAGGEVALGALDGLEALVPVLVLLEGGSGGEGFSANVALVGLLFVRVRRLAQALLLTAVAVLGPDKKYYFAIISCVFIFFKKTMKSNIT